MKILQTLGLIAALALPAVGASAQQQSYGANDYIRQPVRFDKTFTQSLSGGCKYVVNVSGTIAPTAGQQNAKAPELTPHLTVAAQATCPNEASYKVTDNVLGNGPLTWAQLQDSLSRRSRVYTVEKGHQCQYAADFKHVDSRLQLDHFAHSCQAI